MEKDKFQTKHWIIHNSVDNYVDKLITNPQIQVAADWIGQGELVAFPTETVYGLGANAFSEKACQKIFQAKGRPGDNPLIVHISCGEQLAEVVDNVSNLGKRLIEHFWPGPLTLVLPKGEKVCPSVTAGLSTVAVRMPNHPVALALIEAAGVPIAAPSANRSGRPSPTTAQHVLEDLSGRIVGVLDGGDTTVGLESTVVDVTGEQAIILRPGSITKEMLEEIVGEVEVDPALTAVGEEAEQLKPKSPGVKYRHYAPKAELWLVSSQESKEKMQRLLQEKVQEAREQGQKVAVLTCTEHVKQYTADAVISLGNRENLAEIGKHIYGALRQCDALEVDVIFAESFPEAELGVAIMNRLVKAAGGKIFR